MHFFSELILYDQSLVMGPKVGPRFLCLNCMKTLPKDHTYFCSKCNWPVCNLDCEKGKSHQKECATLSSHPKVRKLMTYNFFFSSNCQYRKNSNGLTVFSRNS